MPTMMPPMAAIRDCEQWVLAYLFPASLQLVIEALVNVFKVVLQVPLEVVQ